MEALVVLDRPGGRPLGFAWTWREDRPAGDKAARCVRGKVMVLHDEPGREMLMVDGPDAIQVMLWQAGDREDEDLMAAQAAVRAKLGGTREGARSPRLLARPGPGASGAMIAASRRAADELAARSATGELFVIAGRDYRPAGRDYCGTAGCAAQRCGSRRYPPPR